MTSHVLIQPGRPARGRPALAAGIAVVMAAACIGAVLWLLAAASPAPPGPDGFTVGHAAARWPSETLSDWKSYADQLSLVTVTNERRIVSDDLQRDGGYENRMITVRVEDTLWRRAGGPQIDGSFEMLEYGWLTADGARARFTVEGGVWPEVGETYIAPMVRADDGPWTFLSPAAIVKLAEQRATAAVDGGHPSPALLSLKGHTPEEIRAFLVGAQADPLAVRYAELPPQARSEAVAREKP